MRYLPLIVLFCSLPVFGEETYACFKKGAQDPAPARLKIDGDFVSGPLMIGTFQRHPDKHFCTLSEHIFQSDAGISIVNCFNQQELALFQTTTLFGGFKNDDDDSSITTNITWRCISVD